MKQLSNDKGLTLLEIMVCIAIITILSTGVRYNYIRIVNKEKAIASVKSFQAATTYASHQSMCHRVFMLFEPGLLRVGTYIWHKDDNPALSRYIWQGRDYDISGTTVYLNGYLPDDAGILKTRTYLFKAENGNNSLDKEIKYNFHIDHMQTHIFDEDNSSNHPIASNRNGFEELNDTIDVLFEANNFESSGYFRVTGQFVLNDLAIRK